MARPVSVRGQGRSRVLEAAQELFAEHGVSGTSLQMIADHLGVTKAAVYYQFQAKEDIVLAVVESAFDEMRAFLSSAEAASSAAEASRIAMHGLVDLVLRRRQVVAAMSRDPEVRRVVEAHAEYRTLTTRLGQLLMGPRPDTRRRVAVSVVASGLAHAGVDPQLADLGDAALRVELVEVGSVLLAATEPRG
jgi:AcrR family transcriptional regulator